MKLLIWKVLLKLNSKSYHVVKENKKYLRRDIENSSRKEFEDFLFFHTISRVNENWRGLARMVEYVMWKFQKLNFASSFHQYSNPCEQYFGGEELKVGTCWCFFPMYYLQKESQQFKESTRCWPCFGHSFRLCSLLRSHLRLWLATRMISAHCAPWTHFLQEHDLIPFSQ